MIGVSYSGAGEAWRVHVAVINWVSVVVSVAIIDWTIGSQTGASSETTDWSV